MAWFPPNIEKLTRKQHVSGLLAALQHADLSVRLAAAKALSRLSHPEVLDALLSAAADPETLVRYEAIRLLGNRRELRTVPTLLTALGDPEPHVRRQAIEALGKLGPDAIAPLLLALRREKKEELRYGMILAVGEIGADERVVAALLQGVRDRSLKVRAAAAAQLQQLGVFALPCLVEALRQAEPEVRTVVRGVILAICQHEELQGLAVEKLVALVCDAGDRAQRELSPFISRSGPAAIPPLVQALRSPCLETRCWARHMLDGLHWRPQTEADTIAALWAREEWQALLPYGAAALEPVLEALVRAPAPLRQHVAQHVGRLGERRAVPALLTAAQTDPDERVRHAALQALGALQDPRAIVPLLRLWDASGACGTPAHTHNPDVARLHAQVTETLLRFGPTVQEQLQRATAPSDRLRRQWLAFVQQHRHAPVRTAAGRGASSPREE